MAARTILVEMDEKKWTWAALYEACALARDTQAEIALVKMLPVGYLAWFADEPQAYTFTDAEIADIRDYQAIAAEFGVPLTVHVFEYRDLEQGIVQAADRLNADVVFATVPPGALPFRHDAPLRHLEHELEAHHHHLRRVAVAIA